MSFEHHLDWVGQFEADGRLWVLGGSPIRTRPRGGYKPPREAVDAVIISSNNDSAHCRAGLIAGTPEVVNAHHVAQGTGETAANGMTIRATPAAEWDHHPEHAVPGQNGMSRIPLASIGNRIFTLVLTVFIAATLIWIIPRLSPVDAMLERMADGGGLIANFDVIMQQSRESFGLDQPMFVQFLLYLWNTLRFDFGLSTPRFPAEVSSMIAIALTWTVGLMLVSLMITLQGEDYTTRAKAKGLKKPYIINQYMIRNAILQQITAFALKRAISIRQQMLVERIFSYDGMGKPLDVGVFLQDFPVIQGVRFVIILMTALAVFSVDLLYPLIDPRIRNRA